MKARGLSFPCAFIPALLFASFDAYSLDSIRPYIIDNDSTTVNELNELEVTATQEKIHRLNNGNIRLDIRELNTGARVLGETDLMLTLKTLPGISSAGDYGSGLIIDGSETSQTIFSIDGAPVFFPYRFGGVFSTFNGMHFRTADFERNIHQASMPLRTGGLVNITPYIKNNGVSGAANVGLLSSSVGLRYGDGSKWCVGVATRLSYIDALYGRFLKAEETGLGYNFYDLNLNCTAKIGTCNEIRAGFFFSSDRLKGEGGNYEMDTRINWKNEVVSLGWRHQGTVRKSPDISLTAYYSGYSSSLKLAMPGIYLTAPSEINNIGISTIFKHRMNDEGTLKIDYGGDIDYYLAVPQWCRLEGYGEPQGDRGVKQRFGAERIFGNVIYKLSEHWELNGGISLAFYNNGRYVRFLADPKATVIRKDGEQNITFHFGVYHQYLHQTGFSDIGLASNFWSGATRKSGVTASYNFVGRWYRSFRDLFDLNMELYYKIIDNSPEYDGNILDLIGNSYDALDKISMTHGYSYGANIDISRRIGELSIRLGYAYGDGRRRTGSEKMWRSRTALGHSIKASAEYRIGQHWNLSATFTYMSGRPYTPIKAIYLIAGNIMMDYGICNSHRMPDYQRLDLSGSYIFRTGREKKLTHIVNISLLNATGHKNIEMQYYIINKKNSTIKMTQMSSLYRFLPSISYTVEL